MFRKILVPFSILALLATLVGCPPPKPPVPYGPEEEETTPPGMQETPASPMEMTPAPLEEEITLPGMQETVSITGIIEYSYDYTTQGPVLVVAFKSPKSPPFDILWPIEDGYTVQIAVYGLAELPGGVPDGSYGLQIPQNAGAVYIIAVHDSNGNFVHDAGEPWGEYPGNPLNVGTQDIPNVNFPLAAQQSR